MRIAKIGFDINEYTIIIYVKEQHNDKRTLRKI